MSKWKFHIYLSLSGKVRMISLLLIGITGLVFLYQSNFFEGIVSIDGNRSIYSSEYIQNSILFSKLIFTAYSIFLFSDGVLGNHRLYIIYWLNGTNHRASYLIYKSMTYLLIFLVFWSQVFLLFYVIGKVVSVLEMSSFETFEIFVKLGIQAVFYGFLSMLIVMTFRHSLSQMFTLLIYWSIEFFGVGYEQNGSILMKQVLGVFPILMFMGGKYRFVAETYQYLIIIFAIYLIWFLASVKMEIQ